MICSKSLLLEVSVGVDPKSILCEFFKVGQCTKGFKCNFSHYLNVKRKRKKIDIYNDKRDEGIPSKFNCDTPFPVSHDNPNKNTSEKIAGLLSENSYINYILLTFENL